MSMIETQYSMYLNESSSKEDATNVIIHILKSIEKRPLRASEMRDLYKDIHKICQTYHLHDNDQLDSMIKYRFSMEYLPCVNNLSMKLSNLIPKVDVNSYSKESESSITAKNQTGMNEYNDIKRNYYYLCTIHKNQSTLSTSYRMFLDGTKEIHPITKEISNCVMNKKPIMLLGAKRFKYKTSSSDTNHSNVVYNYIWNHNDSKLWKEKNAIGKLCRMNQNRYIGILIPTTIATANSNVDTRSYAGDSSAQAAEGIVDGSIAISVHSRGLDKLIHLNVVAIVPSYHHHHHEKSEQIERIDNSSFNRHDTVSSSEEDNLSNSTILSQKQLQDSNTIIGSNSTTTIINENETINKLETLLHHMGDIPPENDEKGKCLQENKNILYLKSKPPRNICDNKGKMMHTVVFSNESRVKAPSRKNLVIDVYNAKTAAASEQYISTEWIAVDSNKPAVVQIGKLEEGLFSLDFYGITPFQAFSIALAAFDQ